MKIDYFKPKRHITIDSNTFKRGIGGNIECARLLKKISIKEMAILLNLTHTGYRNIERGITEITITKIFLIAKILNVNTCQLLALEEDNTKNNDRDLAPQNYPNKEIVEALKASIQQYKEENCFLRKQLELLAKYK